MLLLKILFWLSIFIVFYAFLGYGIIITILAKLKKKTYQKSINEEDWMPVTLVVPCFNEASVLDMKIKNCFELEYPSDKLNFTFITDGSTDETVSTIEKYPQIRLLHSPIRAGKSAAENRAMEFVDTPIVIFTDANTLLNNLCIKNIVQHFYDEKVGCVSGEKRVMTMRSDGASATEGIYWKYESYLKKMDSQFYTAVGAAGELVAFRTSLFEPMPHDTLLDDFIQSMQIAAKGYKIVYEPNAYALETASENVKEEFKRKVRICAGGWQSMVRLWPLIGWFKDFKLAFQYYSHRVLRWTIVPFLLIILFFVSALLYPSSLFYATMFMAQIAFYSIALLGYFFEKKNIRIKALFVPFYFCMMNWAVIAGLKKYLKGQQSAIWEKAIRKEVITS